MAQKITVLLTDDMDGSEASQTVQFGLDGKSFEIDLSDGNAEALRKILAPYLEAGRRQKSGGGRPALRTAASRSEDTAKIREWAEKNGFDINARGRIPRNILDAYNQASS